MFLRNILKVYICFFIFRLYIKIFQFMKPTRKIFPSNGIIVKKICNCGNYIPKSTKGVIISDCRNCGGTKRAIIIK